MIATRPLVTQILTYYLKFYEENSQKTPILYVQTYVCSQCDLPCAKGYYSE